MIPIVLQKFKMQCDHCKHNVINGGWCTTGAGGQVIACDDWEPI